MVVYGGSPRGRQLQDIRRNCPHIVVATPGRLADFADSGSIDLTAVRHLVLDEADLMLDMGFKPQIDDILEEFMTPQDCSESRPLPSRLFGKAGGQQATAEMMLGSDPDATVIEDQPHPAAARARLAVCLIA